MTDTELIKRLAICTYGCMNACKHAYWWKGTCGNMQSCDFDDICDKHNNYNCFELNREFIEKDLEEY